MRFVFASLIIVVTLFYPRMVMALQFPTMQSENLNQRAVNLPAAFNSRRNIVFIAYAQDQQQEVDSWNRFLADAIATYDDVDYFELPTVASGYRLVKGFLDGVMRDGIPDIDKRERTITLFTNVRQFREKLALPDNRTIDVLVLDGSGTVIAKTRGRFTEEAAKIVIDALN